MPGSPAIGGAARRDLARRRSTGRKTARLRRRKVHDAGRADCADRQQQRPRYRAHISNWKLKRPRTAPQHMCAAI